MDIEKQLNITLDKDFNGYEQQEPGSAYGVIKINDFYENFYMSPEVWSIDDYQRQWQIAFDRLNSGASTCFVVNFQPSTPLIAMWTVYHCGNKLYIQNQYYFGDYYHEVVTDKSFTPENSFDFIRPRQTATDEGDSISEWVIE